MVLVIKMQRNEIKAFRQRLVRAGFTKICIDHYGQGLYKVFCIPPDGKGFISKMLRVSDMVNIPRTVWFD